MGPGVATPLTLFLLPFLLCALAWFHPRSVMNASQNVQWLVELQDMQEANIQLEVESLQRCLTQ